MLPELALKFMRAGSAVRKSMIRCGFELETQWSDVGDEEFDEDGFSQAVNDRVDSEIGGDLAHVLDMRCNRAIRDQVRMALYDYYSDNDDLRTEFYSTEKPESPHELVAVGTDGSVSGWEFRTVGGLKYQQFIDATDAVFGVDHTIDTRCSFHIHLSIPGVEHRYGVNIQRAVAEFFALNVSRLPLSVQERLKHAAINSYINHLTGKEQKYCFLRFHPQGTWEFRCIGNVHNEIDAQICLDFCIDALAYAYAVSVGDARLYWRSAVSEEAWRSAIFEALEFNHSRDTSSRLFRFIAAMLRDGAQRAA